jgi:hypothetical protein
MLHIPDITSFDNNGIVVNYCYSQPFLHHLDHIVGLLI